jgi:hypothetical protein
MIMSPVASRRRQRSAQRSNPFLDQTDDARVSDPVLQEAYQPTLTDSVEEALDIRV